VDYISDFVNDPSIVNHPGFALLAKRGLELQNTLARQGFSPRQGPIGVLTQAFAGQGSVRLLFIA
jgi:hypothetical protein